MDKVFLDSAYAIALSVPRDRHHERARQLARELTSSRASLVTSIPVVCEIGDGLAGTGERAGATRLLLSILSDPSVEIIEVTASLLKRAVRLYAARPDKSWGLTDCVSFVVMEDQEIMEALTTDHHFEQAGFRALLREP